MIPAAQTFSPQLLDSFGQLNSIQIIQLMMLVALGGLLLILWRFVGNQKSQNENFKQTTDTLLSTMQTQSSQSDKRENKLAEAIDRQAASSEMQANESKTVGRILMLMHKEQKRQNTVSVEQHAVLLKRFDELASQITALKAEVKSEANNAPDQAEVLRRLDQILGYVESMRLKNRTSDVPKLSTGEVLRVNEAGARSDSENGFKLEASDNTN